jgi:preprotein translocase subunit YajC
VEDTLTLLTNILYAQDKTTDAVNTAAKTAQGSGANYTLVMMFLMIAVFYFLIIRPQQKKEKARKNMISEIKEGDRVITAGGMYGTVSAIKKEQDILVLKISENSKVEFARSAIQKKI